MALVLNRLQAMDLLPGKYNCTFRKHRECWEHFPHHRLQRKPLVSDPSMHHGTCVTHVPWCMSGLLTRGGRENVPGIPGACATSNLYISGKRPIMWINVDHELWCHMVMPDANALKNCSTNSKFADAKNQHACARHNYCNIMQTKTWYLIGITCPMFGVSWYLYGGGIVLGMGSANEWKCYIETSSLIGCAHTSNDPCVQASRNIIV